MTTRTARQKASKLVTLYHVTPTANYASIAAYGIHPRYSRGKQKASWYVRADMLLWAIAHTSARHHISVERLTVYSVRSESALFLRTPWPGVYKTGIPFAAFTEKRATAYLEEPEMFIQTKGALDRD
jgi:hypothetical protein